MKQTVDTGKSPQEPITDIDVVFTALYNLLSEKLREEPNKGIVVSRGNPNQRRVRWSDVMRMSHMVEDFFLFREMHIGDKTCSNCKHWESVSKASPHMGKCKRKNKPCMHSLHCCKKWKGTDR